jgi:predicted nucleic acid-binding protein
LSFSLDASVVVPTLVKEDATEIVKRFLSEAREPLVVSALAAVDVASALSRLTRMKALAPEIAAALLADFDKWRMASTLRRDLEPSDFNWAERLVRRFDLGLKAPDALHAAACLRENHTLVTFDRRLAVAAEGLGAKVVRLP